MTGSPFTTDEEFAEEVRQLEEKFYTVGLGRREFVEFISMLRSLDRPSGAFFAALQLPTELPSEWDK